MAPISMEWRLVWRISINNKIIRENIAYDFTNLNDTRNWEFIGFNNIKSKLYKESLQKCIEFVNSREW